MFRSILILIEVGMPQMKKLFETVSNKVSGTLNWLTEDQYIIDEIVESFIISILKDKIEIWKAIYPS